MNKSEISQLIRTMIFLTKNMRNLEVYMLTKIQVPAPSLSMTVRTTC